MKATAIAPSNIAFTKYWGKKDEKLKLPENASISMNLSKLLTTTTVEFNEMLKKDSVDINGMQNEQEIRKVIEHLDRIRRIAKIKPHAKVVSRSNFPTGTGLSSSASGFAALTLAALEAAGLQLSEKESSILARKGSGSACRSVPNGFVEWIDGDTNESSYAVSLYPASYWNIRDVVAIVSDGRKKIGSTQGQKMAATSPFYKTRLSLMNQKNKLLKQALHMKDFKTFGEILEQDALELHAVMLTSHPALIYWTPATLHIMKLVQEWREQGLEVYFTLNTGQDIHLIVQEPDVEKLKEQLKEIDEIKEIIVNSPTDGARTVDAHLF